jgi:hypothetical protein
MIHYELFKLTYSREKSHCTFFDLWSERNPIALFLPLDSRTRNLREIPLHYFLPLDSRNQESTQIPDFCNPMVKKVQWDFSLITWGLYAYYLLNVEVPLYNGRIQPGKCGVTTVHCMATEVVTSPLSWSCGKERIEKEILNVSTVHSKLCFSA